MGFQERDVVDKRLKTAIKYLRSLSGILILCGILLLLVSGYCDWHNFVENLGLALSAAGITTFLFKYDIYQMISDNGLRQSGIEAVKQGRNAMLEHVGGTEDLLRKARPKEIDICGIAMYSFFEPHSIYNLLIQLASEGYRIRIAFADPTSPELGLQEDVEHKPGSLKHHIEYVVDAIARQMQNHSNQDTIRQQFTVVYSRLLPKAFIVRAGSKMLVTEYFHRGPHFSPTYFLLDVPGGIFEEYRDYLDDVFRSDSRRVDMCNRITSTPNTADKLLREESQRNNGA